MPHLIFDQGTLLLVGKLHQLLVSGMVVVPLPGSCHCPRLQIRAALLWSTPAAWETGTPVMTFLGSSINGSMASASVLPPRASALDRKHQNCLWNPSYKGVKSVTEGVSQEQAGYPGRGVCGESRGQWPSCRGSGKMILQKWLQAQPWMGASPARRH